MTALRLGLSAPTHDSRDLMFSRYVDTTVLPTPPKTFGQVKVTPDDGWGMLLNDQLSDCAIAGPAHEHMHLTSQHGPAAAFTDQTVESDYSAVTGYVPGDPATDQGTDMRVLAKYRQKTGMLDASGRRHKIGAYLWLTPGNVTEAVLATFLFGTIGVGYSLPRSAEDQFRGGHPWTVIPHSPILGGHYVPTIARTRSGLLDSVTWSKRIQIADAFYVKYCTQAIVYVSTDWLDPKTGKAPNGFNASQLAADLAAL